MEQFPIAKTKDHRPIHNDKKKAENSGQINSNPLSEESFQDCEWDQGIPHASKNFKVEGFNFY